MVSLIDCSWLNPKFFTDDCDVVVDNPHYVAEKGRKAILFVLEPEAIYNHRYIIMENANNFCSIYTCDQEILDKFPKKAIKLVGNYTFLKEAEIEALSVDKKEFKISSWAASKIFPGVEGHMLRAVLYFNQQLFPSNFTFFRSSRPHSDPPPGLEPILPNLFNNPFFFDNKVPLFETFQFAVSIENSRQINYFTEKIIDCLLARCIPIYWGCPNISEFFDTTGWIIFDDCTDLLGKIQVLDSEYYMKYIETVEKNFIIAGEYKDCNKNIERQKKEPVCDYVNPNNGPRILNTRWMNSKCNCGWA
jgi:hypothetical protein